MLRPVLFALLFIVAGLILFALLAPLLFRDQSMRQIGQIAFPVVVVVAGLAGFFFGRRMSPNR